MKNKTGGFAPNYLVVLTTEGKSGLIMDYQVPASDDEPSTVMPAMNNLKEAVHAGQTAGTIKGNPNPTAVAGGQRGNLK